MRIRAEGVEHVPIGVVVLLGIIISVAAPISAQDAGWVTVIDEDFTENTGVFSRARVSDEDVEIADGVLSLIGRRDGTGRTMDGSFGAALPGRVTIAARMRADEGAYGGLYIYGGGRIVVQIGIGQGPGGEGLLVEIDNHDHDLRQRFYPDIGTKQQWRDYLVEVDEDRVTVTVDGEQVVGTTFSGRHLGRVTLWNGMNSLGAVATDTISVLWRPSDSWSAVQTFRQNFGDPSDLAGWASSVDTVQLQIVEDEDADNRRALHSDFRHRGRWLFMQQTPISLQAQTQYELKMRLRAISGVMGVRLSISQIGSSQPLARIDSRNTRGYIDRTATFVTGAEPGLGWLTLEGTWGGGTVWIDSIEISPADPPRDPYETGVQMLHSTIQEAGSRVGLMIEAEDAVDAGRITDAEVDGDGRWTRVEMQMPEEVVCDVNVNPWGFSNNTVLKSDSSPDGESLVLRFPTVIPGRYRAYLGNTMRDIALREDGEWTRVTAGREYDLGVVDLDDDFEIVVAHAFSDELNPGPVYLDYVRFLPLADEHRIAAEARAVHEARMAAQEASRGRADATFAPVTLTVSERGDVARNDEPVITGVPFAPGQLQAGAALLLEDADGASRAFSAEPLAHWPDGSVKWLRLRFHTDLEAGGETEVVLRHEAGGQTLSVPQEVEELGAEAVIESGALRVILGEGLIERVEVDSAGDARTVLSGPVTARMGVGDRETVEVPIAIGGYRLIERSPMATTVAFEGDLQWDGPEIGVQGRLVIEEGRPVMTVEAWLVHQDPSRRLQLHEAELVLGMTSWASSVTVGTDDGAFEGAIADGRVAVQLGEGYDVASFEGVATIEGPTGGVLWQFERLSGWMMVAGDGGAVAVGVREMTERYPKALGAEPEGDGTWLTFAIWPAAAEEPFEWHQGAALAHHIGLAFLDGDSGAGDAASALAATMHPLRAIATAEHYCSSGAFGAIAPVSETARWPSYEAEVRRAFDLIVDHRSAWGMEDFGGVFQPGGYVPGTRRMWTNMEYDFSHATLSQFARTARVDMLERADQATRHFTPVDIIHWTPTERDLGGSRTHSHTMVEGHQVGGANFGHGGWPQGPLQVYYLTGERQGLDAGRLIAGYIARNAGPRPDDTTGRPLYGLREERDAGNAILTSIVTYEATNDLELLEVAYRVLDFIERCQHPDLGNWDTPITEDPPHRGTTFMIHQLIKGLDAMYEVTGEPRIEPIFARLSEWLLTEACDDSYRYASKYSPRFWRGRSVRNFPRYALALERAAQFSTPEVAAALRRQAVGTMDALFGPSGEQAPNALFETDTADAGRHSSARVFAGEAGAFHDYAVIVRGEALAFEVNGLSVHEGTFSGHPARWLRLWSGIRSLGLIEIEQFVVERLGPDGAVETVMEFTFDDPSELAQWSARVPDDTGSRIEITDGRLVLVDAEQALMGAELALPDDLGPDYRIRWRQSMPEQRYGGLMVFGPGDFEFDLYAHRPVAIIQVGLNQADRPQYAGLFDNPRSFAPAVTYLNQLVGRLERE